MGIILCLLAKSFNYEHDEGGPIKLASCAMKEIQVLMNDLTREESNLDSIHEIIYTICVGGLCCFVEDVLNEESAGNFYMLFFIIVGKIATISLNNVTKKFLDLQIWEKKAKFNNLKTVCKYIEKYPHQLTQIISLIDQGIPPNIEWTHDKRGEFVFYGRWKKDQYHVNISNGIVLKNGKELSGLPSAIKSHRIYKRIF